MTLNPKAAADATLEPRPMDASSLHDIAGVGVGADTVGAVAAAVDDAATALRHSPLLTIRPYEGWVRC